MITKSDIDAILCVPLKELSMAIERCTIEISKVKLRQQQNNAVLKKTRNDVLQLCSSLPKWRVKDQTLNKPYIIPKYNTYYNSNLYNKYVGKTPNEPSKMSCTRHNSKINNDTICDKNNDKNIITTNMNESVFVNENKIENKIKFEM